MSQNKFYDSDFLENSKFVKIKNSETLKVIKYNKYNVKNENFLELEYLRNCRGTVVNENNEIVSMPFKKIFNWGEIKENGINLPIINTENEVIAVQKINGFMLSLSKFNGDLIFSTTGSLENSHIELAKEYFKELKKESIKEEFTYLFEIVHPLDPHIIFNQKFGAYLIGIRENSINGKLLREDELDEIAKTLIIGNNSEDKLPFRATWSIVSFNSVIQNIGFNYGEGFIIREASESQEPLTKLKSPYYLYLKKSSRSNKFSSFVQAEEILNKISTSKLLKEYFEKAKKDSFRFLNESEQNKIYFLLNGEYRNESLFNSQQIVLTIGLPASGKSTWAKEIIKQNSNVKEINRDELRMELFNSLELDKEQEKCVSMIQDERANFALKQGQSIIISDMNLNILTREKWKQLSQQHKVILSYKSFLDVSLEECITRDSKRIKQVGEEVLKEIYNHYNK